jgi:hypothetical protein
MKIRAAGEPDFDERMMMKQQIPGLLPMEKCYMDGEGQFWYDISGRQSLDTFCRMKPVGQVFLEQMVHSICDEIRTLEQHLVDAGCLSLAPELIYVSNRTEELAFTAIPGSTSDVATGFRELMEYLLTRVDHKDAKAVQLAYDIYEKTLDEGYSIADIHNSIIQSHLVETSAHSQPYRQVEPFGVTQNPNSTAAGKSNVTMEKSRESVEKPLEIFSVGRKDNKSTQKEKPHSFWEGELSVRVKELLENWKEKFKKNGAAAQKNRKEDIFAQQKNQVRWHRKKAPESQNEWRVVYPDDELQEEIHNRIHPTVCLSDYREHPEGLLLYEGYENFSNIRLENRSHQIGQSDDSDITIAKDTISRYHARIECQNSDYYLEDLNSTNGTFVNEKQLTYKEKRKLESNDIIRFADVKYRFV